MLNAFNKNERFEIVNATWEKKLADGRTATYTIAPASVETRMRYSNGELIPGPTPMHECTETIEGHPSTSAPMLFFAAPEREIVESAFDDVRRRRVNQEAGIMATERRYSLEELEQAFRDGLAAGIASQDGTFGEEDFMGEAGTKAELFIKKSHRGIYPTDWEDLWAYCGGGNVLDEPETYTPATAKKNIH